MLQTSEQRAINASKKLERAIIGAGVEIDRRASWHREDHVLFQASNTFYNTNDAYQRKQGHYPYIPLGLQRFFELLDATQKQVHGTPHFIDVGCGIGDKLIVANWYCDIPQVSGIEYNAHTFAVAEKIAKPIATDLVRGDALAHDFGAYNLIYMYHPIEDMANMRTLFTHIARTMPEDGIIVEALPNYFRITYGDLKDRDASYSLENTDEDYWLKDPVFSLPYIGVRGQYPFAMFRKRDGKVSHITEY